ncbi:pyruvate formate lyase-activating protein [Lactonifactor longoviformis]|uniref:Pyruvate formate-lyase-activating enzyme n=1 Tax=Lactonifactor longoviformis DSM 17459 TaxID=1122155 RepID=A0A1M4ZR10_9CLOT|nr:pyruvate formate-lyase-activating protein [Lactonifactor longoviformis]POP33113.1 pyruvate formate lyase-activating protein [Lactonifactor longoviformis]SHF20365.1 pyruvate formate lyase activating enzyme [Lactonifactor longoviformis DSM 17459]
MTGYIHSLETFGSMDGPGIRLVIFFQGCPLRCLYCHNPDTWAVKKGTRMSAEEILDIYEKNMSFYKKGGITATGGEPMLQLDFLTELFAAAKKRGIHTCLDTSGITYPREGSSSASKKIDQLLAATDLVLLDLKQIDDASHQALTGRSNQPVLHFLRHLDEKKIPVWIRHVLVPGITDSPSQLCALGYAIGEYSCVQALDVLPYHSMGKAKYEALQIPYPLGDTREATKEEAEKARILILAGMKKRRKL